MLVTFSVVENEEDEEDEEDADEGDLTSAAVAEAGCTVAAFAAGAMATGTALGGPLSFNSLLSIDDIRSFA